MQPLTAAARSSRPQHRPSQLVREVHYDDQETQEGETVHREEGRARPSSDAGESPPLHACTGGRAGHAGSEVADSRSEKHSTRLTNGFSKKWDNHRASMALHFAWFNFGRVHLTLKTTPAVAAGWKRSRGRFASWSKSQHNTRPLPVFPALSALAGRVGERHHGSAGVWLKTRFVPVRLRLLILAIPLKRIGCVVSGDLTMTAMFRPVRVASGSVRGVGGIGMSVSLREWERSDSTKDFREAG